MQLKSEYSYCQFIYLLNIGFDAMWSSGCFMLRATLFMLRSNQYLQHQNKRKRRKERLEKLTKSARFPTHSPLAVTSPIFSPLAKALYIGVRVEVEVTAPTFCTWFKINLEGLANYMSMQQEKIWKRGQWQTFATFAAQAKGRKNCGTTAVTSSTPAPNSIRRSPANLSWRAT